MLWSQILGKLFVGNSSALKDVKRVNNEEKASFLHKGKMPQ